MAFSGLTMLLLASTALGQTLTTTTPPRASQTTTAASVTGARTSVFLPFNIPSLPTSLVAPVSAVGASPPRTTFAIACSDLAVNSAIAATICPSNAQRQSITFTAGPSVMQVTVEANVGGAKATVAVSCDIQGSTAAICTSLNTISSIIAFTQTTTSTYLGSPTLNFLPVAITAGATDRPAPNQQTTTKTNAAPGYVSGTAGLGLLGTIMGILSTLI